MVSIDYNMSFVTCVPLANFLVITVNFSQSNYGANENDGLVQPMLVLSNPSSSDITIRVDTIDREATGERLKLTHAHSRSITALPINSLLVCFVGMDQDYFSGPYFILFPAGTTESVFNIVIMDDDVLEETETFEVVINFSSLPSNVTSGEPGNAAVIIRDNDGESE